MAIKAQAPIVPVAVTGGRDAMRRGSAIVRPVRMSVRIGAPVPTAGLTLDDRDRADRRGAGTHRGAGRRRADRAAARLAADGAAGDRGAHAGASRWPPASTSMRRWRCSGWPRASIWWPAAAVRRLRQHLDHRRRAGALRGGVRRRQGAVGRHVVGHASTPWCGRSAGRWSPCRRWARRRRGCRALIAVRAARSRPAATSPRPGPGRRSTSAPSRSATGRSASPRTCSSSGWACWR